MQLSKGKLNPDTIVTNINGIDEDVFYHMASCNGVKGCSVPDCSNAQPLNSKKNLCSKHSSSSTDKTSAWLSSGFHVAICFHKNSLMIIEGTCKEVIMSIVLMYT